MLHFRILPTFAHFYGSEVYRIHVVFYSSFGLFAHEQDPEE
jgi:hypothetical protein